MNQSNRIHLFVKLNDKQLKILKRLAKERYGKASVSLFTEKWLQEQAQEAVQQTDPDTELIYQENEFGKPRSSISWRPTQYEYLTHKATVHNESISSLVCDIVQEHMTKYPVVSNEEIQGLYQANYQLLRMGRNINQLARQFNAIMPQSLTTQQLNQIADFLDFHIQQVAKILIKQPKAFKYRPISEFSHATTEPTNR